MKTNSEHRLHKLDRHYILRNVITVGLLILGAIYICFFIAIMQGRATEKKQAQSSAKILNEITETLTDNDRAAYSIQTEYNSLNQSTVETACSFMVYKNVFETVKDESQTDEEYAQNLTLICAEFQDWAKDFDVENLYLIDKSGLIYICSDANYVNTNVFDDLGYQGVNRSRYTVYRTAADGTVSVNGTVTHSDVDSYDPLITSDDEGSHYSYFSYLGEFGTSQYFLVSTVSGKILNQELSFTKNISSVLEGVTVGKSGFLFAIDTESKQFKYFNDGTNDFSGQEYSQYGVTSDMEQEQFTGYQTINGVEYYCVTQSISSSFYGQCTVVAAVVTSEELTTKNLSAVITACAAFVIVAAIVAGYGMILRRDIADHLLGLEKRFTNELKDEVSEGKAKFNDQEIDERVRIKIQDNIDKNDDKQLKRRLIGTRNKKGNQTYYSSYLGGKIFPVMAVGLAAIFAISFFSQTLLSLQDAINISTTRISDIQETLEKNQENVDTIQAYVNNQFVAKTKLISYLLEESPEALFVYDLESSDIHPLFVKDENGVKTYLTDQYGNLRYSIEKSAILDGVCEQNDFSSIYVYDEDGFCMATSGENWYQTVNSDSSLAIMSDVIDGKEDSAIEKIDYGTTDDTKKQNIGYVFYYYTYLDDDGNTVYTNADNYTEFILGTWTKGDITKHRSVIQIEISTDAIADLFEVTQLTYVLNNMHVYGEDSFFMAFDSSDDHKVLYSPVASSIGETASEIGIKSDAFKENEVYNGFQTINGTKYYQTYSQVGNYYFATAIPTDSLYDTRNQIALYTLLFSAVFLILASGFYTISNDRDDQAYKEHIKASESPKKDIGKMSFFLSTPNGRIKTSSAASRYSKVGWAHKTVEQKLTSILMGYMNIVSLFIIVSLILAWTHKTDNSVFSYILSNSWERGFNIFSVTESIMILILVITVTSMAKFLVKSFCGTLGARVETIGNLIVSILKYGGILGGIFYCMYLFGFDSTGLLASAGIMTIVIGLGAQSLISDILAGMFLVFEGEFRVGDIVTIGDFRGQVLEIGLRTTKLQDAAKNIKIFNNSSISNVLNMTKEASYAVLDLSFDYGESIERVELVLQKAFPDIKKKFPKIIDGPYYKGVVEQGDSGIIIRVVAGCEEKDRMQLIRDLNREFLILFEKNNIEIPYTQLTLSYQKGEESKEVKQKQAQKAEEFVENQKAASSAIEPEATQHTGK